MSSMVIKGPSDKAAPHFFKMHSNNNKNVVPRIPLKKYHIYRPSHVTWPPLSQIVQNDLLSICIDMKWFVLFSFP